MRETYQRLEDAASAVTVIEVGEEYVTLDVPESVHDAARAIPYDLVEFGQDALNWFAWDMETKQPRVPHNGYAGPAQWGGENVSWDDRAGGTFEDVMDALQWETNGHVDESWQWQWLNDEQRYEDPRPLYPMCIVPHAQCSPEPGLMFFDIDDVVNPCDDGTAVMTREAWDIINRLDCYAELSTSMTGVHCFALGEMPGVVDGKKVLQDLNQSLPNGEIGHLEIYGYPANGRVIGTTWMHIDRTPRHTVADRQDVIDELTEELLPDDKQLSDAEQAERAYNDHVSGNHDVTSSGSKSAYYRLNVEAIADTGPFSTHGRNGRGPHPGHGGTSTPDAESTNFTVDRSDGWKCWAHDDGGGALQLIAVLEGIRDCGDAADVMSDPVDALRTCLAARDRYAGGRLDGEDPPTAALKGVLEVQDVSYSDDGMLERSKYELARSLFGKMEYVR